MDERDERDARCPFYGFTDDGVRNERDNEARYEARQEWERRERAKANQAPEASR